MSKFYGEGNVFRYWYCDIIKTEYRKEDNSYLFTDLLADVVVFPDGSVRVVDLDEVSEALDQGADYRGGDQTAADTAGPPFKHHIFGRVFRTDTGN